MTSPTDGTLHAMACSHSAIRLRMLCRSIFCSAVLVLASCAQPPVPTPPLGEVAPPPSAPLAEGAGQSALAPQYPSWEEVQARQAGPQAGTEGSSVFEAPALPQTGSVSASADGQPLSGGASLHETTVSQGGRAIDFQVVLFDDRHFTLKVIDQPEDFAGGGRITHCMRQAGAVAGVNGGFFTPEFTPMGLMIADGRSTGTWQVNKLLTGAVMGGGKGPRLLWNAEARGRLGADQFLQAGPRLVDAGQAVGGLERARHTTRTFIATDGGHRWIFGLARGTSLGELADTLASAEVVPGFRIERALNLDGGRSSALYYRAADGREHSDPGWSTVRNYLGIVPR